MIYEMWIVPNSFTENGQGNIDVIHEFDSYEEAYEDVLNEVKDDKNPDYHYTIVEYDENDNVTNEWQFDHNGNAR